MTTHSKIGYLLVALLLTGFAKQSQAQTFDLAQLGVQAVAGGAGYVIGKAFHSNTAAAVGAGLGPVIAGMGYQAFKNKANRDKLDSFMAGQDYQRWIQSTKHWYDLTLDPNTGFGEAFTGLNYGPGRNTGAKSSRGGTSGQNPSEFTKKDDGSDQLQDATPFNPVIVGEGSYNGVFRTKRVLWFPTLN
jgi:hypothetical protein